VLYGLYALAVGSQCVVLCVVVDASNKKVNKVQSFAPSFLTVEFCSCSLENDFSAALVSRWRTLVSWRIN
jgi:hypothetical protein